VKISIRRAIVDDAPAILHLNAVYEDVRATVVHIATHIEYHSHFETPFVAIVNEQVVGLACLRLLRCLCDPVPYAELTELIVDPLYRRQKVGKSLVRHIEREAHNQGAVMLTIATAWHNQDAQAFYHEMGYRLYTITLQRSLLDTEQPDMARSST